MRNSNDEYLVERCINGDLKAWHKFVERFSSLVFWAIRKLLGRSGYSYNQHDVEDIFQEVFVLLWEKGKLKQIRNRKKISVWLVVVSANCAHNFFRSKNKNVFVNETSINELTPACNGLIKENEQENLNAMLEEALDLLSAREIIALRLSYLYNKTHQEIGQILNIPANTVSSIIKRVKEKLKQRLSSQS